MFVTISRCRDMHASHFMSHKVSLPISLIPLAWKRARLDPVSKREFTENPASTTLRYKFSEVKDECDHFDPWTLRDEFLGWRIEDWKDFFLKFGRWCNSSYITQSDFVEWQQLLREALVRPAKDWQSLVEQFAVEKVLTLTSALEILFTWQGYGLVKKVLTINPSLKVFQQQSTIPVALVPLKDSLAAILATMQVDALQGAEFRVCARPDCKSAPFRVEARQKIYCSPECAHLVAVRNSRKRAAEREAAVRKQQGKDGRKHGTQETR